ncbi:MAG: DUF4344 domain-containing metallopeptidase [Paracoccaceae bacterium]
MRKTLLTAMFVAFPLCAQAEEPSEEAIEFVRGNVLSIFYHEFGHALVDMLGVPVMGREEDAADALSVILTNEMWDEEEARSAAWVTAEYWLQSASETADAEPDYSDVHSLDMQRYFTHICLFYGANPDARGEFVTEFQLPADRAEGCADEYARTSESWGLYLDEIATETPGTSIKMEVDTADSISMILGYEVEGLNEAYVLPEGLTVSLESCGEVNAFYDSSTKSITFCTEYVDYLWGQAEAMNL